MRLELQKVSRKIDAKALADILRRDGAAIVENALDEDLLSAGQTSHHRCPTFKFPK